MVIDVHTHLNNYETDKTVPLQARFDQLRESMRFNRVDQVLILSSYTVNEHRPSTRELIEITADTHDMHVVAGLSVEHYKERDLRELADFLKAGKVKALKLYPGYEPFYPYDRRCQVLYDLAMEFGVPVMFHTGDTYNPRGKIRFSHPINIDDVAVDNPELKIVLCHIGNPWIRDCMEVIYKNRNCYADISGLVLGDFKSQFKRFMLQQVKEMILYAGEPRYLLYGTDWPICRMRTYLQFVRDLKLPAEKHELIMWRNAAQLYKLPMPAAEPKGGAATEVA